MIDGLPNWVEWLFLVSFFLTIGLFHFSNGRPTKVTISILLWSAIHAYLAYIGFYLNIEAFPPRFGWVLIPAGVFIILGILPRQRSWFKANRNSSISTLLHLIRFPVEIVLFGLFSSGMIPELMTFEGRNFDIIMGITAPIMALLAFKGKIGKKAVLVWNYTGLILILFILSNGILSAELPFQQFAFDQPNRGIAYFPFVLLPATIVPIVIWTHISDIIILTSNSDNKKAATEVTA